MKNVLKTGASLMMVALLAACAGNSMVDAEGKTAQPVFPDNNFMSTYPTKIELEQVKEGMTKDQIYKLLGRPHFNEGMFGVREWDYIFRSHKRDDVCRFKVTFDKNMLVGGVYKRGNCMF